MDEKSAAVEKIEKPAQDLAAKQALHVMRNAMMPISVFLRLSDEQLTDPALRELLGAAQTAYQKIKQALTQLP